MTPKNSTKYVLASNIDNQHFEVNQKIIDASVLLKNICGLTEVTKSINLECSAQSLNIFIKLIDHYETINVEHDSEFEENFFKNFNDHELIKLVQEICILDSDFFVASVANFILTIIKDQEIEDWKEMQVYLGLEDDFTLDERNLIEKYKLEYLLSINCKNTLKMEFPFLDKNFVTLKTKFHSPMNVLLAKIVERSRGLIAFNLSLINKTMKNENDRHPIKLSLFQGSSDFAILEVGHKLLKLFPNEEYFNIIRKRKVISDRFRIMHSSLSNDESNKPGKGILLCSSLDFGIPLKNTKVEIYFQRYKEQINYFDVKSCPFSSIYFHFCSMDEYLNFDDVYKQLIAKDLSKQVEIFGSVLNFFHDRASGRAFKKLNASKFHECFIPLWTKKKPFPEFKKFISNYMESDGIICVPNLVFDISKNRVKKVKEEFIYKVSDIVNYL